MILASSLGLGDTTEDSGETPRADEEGKRPNTRVRDVVPVRRVKLILGLQYLFKEFGIIFIVEGRVATEPGQRKTHVSFNSLTWGVGALGQHQEPVRTHRKFSSLPCPLPSGSLASVP